MKVCGNARLLLLGLSCLLWFKPCWSAERVRLIVTGSERSTSAQIARDIAKYIAPAANIELDVRHSSSSADTLARLRDGGGLQWAMLQADAADAYLSAAADGSVEAGVLFAPLRVMTPLYQEDIYFFVRRDSPLNYVHEIRNARINLGEPRSGTAMTVTTLYRRMFGASLPEAQASFRSPRDALAKLTEQAVDVVALVAPRPAKLLADMKPEARAFVKLLKFDEKHPGASDVTKLYSAATIPATSYPNLLSEDLSTLSVGIYLVSHGQGDSLQGRFAKAWCQNLPLLRSEGHPVLRNLETASPALASGWHYSKPFERALQACREGKEVASEVCSTMEKALVLCR